jgi:hypothetical protein
MRRSAFLVVVASMMLVGLVGQPADAAWKGRRCQNYPSPNWVGAYHRICALVNQNDISKSLQGLIQYGSDVQPKDGRSGAASAIYVDWIVLIKNGTVVKRIDPDVWIPAGSSCCQSSATGWTSGSYGSKFKAQAAFKLKWYPNGSPTTCCHSIYSNTWTDL